MYIIAENQTVLRPNIITPCPCRSETHRIVRVVGWREAVVEKFVVVIDVGKLERPEHMDTPFSRDPRVSASRESSPSTRAAGGAKLEGPQKPNYSPHKIRFMMNLRDQSNKHPRLHKRVVGKGPNREPISDPQGSPQGNHCLGLTYMGDNPLIEAAS